MDPKMLKESIETILHLIGLVNDRQTLSKNLSGGMKRRLSIGISLIGDPKVLRFVLFFFLYIMLSLF
jgi:ATP-binding cassette subfamily A (ABC1) protein 3